MGGTIEAFRTNLQKGKVRQCGSRSKWCKSKACEENRLKILKFDNEKAAKGISESSRLTYLFELHKFAEFLKEKKFESVTKEDTQAYINHLESGGKSKATRFHYGTLLKQFFSWLTEEESPKCMSWFKGTFNRTTITENDILSPDEIKSLITAAKSWRDKAIISCLYESACRCGELVGVKMKNLLWQRDNTSVKMTVTGKTGTRTLPLEDSVPYIKEWLKQHPDRNNPEAYLWVDTSKWRRWKNGNGFGNGLKTGIISLILKNSAEKAGIQKRVHPHLLRHSHLTFLAPRIKESLLRKFAGWTKRSTQVETYIHLSDKDLEDSLMENVYGKEKIEPERVERKLAPKSCWACGTLNPFEIEFCINCKSPIDETMFKGMVENIINKRLEQLKDEQLRRENNVQ